MSQTWGAPEPEAKLNITALGWLRALIRGSLLIVVTFGCLGLLLLVRLVERPVWGQHRPWTPYITQFVCHTAFVILGIRLTQTGERMEQKGAVVSNHTSWLDIFALNARKRIYFVSKAEVARWPGIGWLARSTGTVFIHRNPLHAGWQKAMFEERLNLGHKLLFFPEGTSTDGLRVLPFKPTLFAAFYSPGLRESLWIQPVTVVYHAPKGEEPRFYGWWGEMDLAPHLLKTLSAARQGSVELVYHAPVRVADYPDRKTLAAVCEAAVRSGHNVALAHGNA